MAKATKYIFVTGGVLSGLGKGITAASIGNLLVRRGLKVFMQKFDQYLNVDAGTINPNEHGEVFVTDDGAEADLDLGHYERFIDANMTRESSVMSGQIYAKLLEKERRGDFLGEDVQFIPHLVPLVMEHIERAAKSSGADVLIIEIGGTIGDYEGLHFVEAAREFALCRRKDVMFVHVGFLPYLLVTEEVKTKPLQNSINDLRRFGIQPDLVAARCDYHVPASALKKIALFGGLPPEAVIPLETLDSVYKVPLVLEQYKVDQQIIKRLGLKAGRRHDHDWHALVAAIDRVKGPRAKTVTIGVIGKYMEMKDTYMSVTEALKAAGWKEGVRINEVWIEAEDLEKAGPTGLGQLFKGIDGVVVPGGFGTRGVEGIILAADYARRKGIPYLGLCYGMQLAVIAHARYAVGLDDAHTTEVNAKTPYPVIDILPDQDLKKLGGTMRLGAYPARLEKTSQLAKLYRELRPAEVKEAKGSLEVSERHRHRYEVNPAFHPTLQAKGLQFVGLSPDGTLVEFIEYDKKAHPYFVGTQAHPELRSRPNRPHPLFVGLVRAAKVGH